MPVMVLPLKVTAATEVLAQYMVPLAPVFWLLVIVLRFMLVVTALPASINVMVPVPVITQLFTVLLFIASEEVDDDEPACVIPLNMVEVAVNEILDRVLLLKLLLANAVPVARIPLNAPVVALLVMFVTVLPVITSATLVLTDVVIPVNTPDV